MIKRIFGWLLFLWMLGCLYGLLFDKSMDMDIAPGPKFWTKLGIGAFIVAVAGIGLMMGLGLNTSTGTPKDPPSDPPAASGTDIENYIRRGVSRHLQNILIIRFAPDIECLVCC